jgi:hypothetical protein
MKRIPPPRLRRYSPLQGEKLFKSLRMKRRQPNPPFYLLELDLPFEEVMADLTYPSPKLV